MRLAPFATALFVVALSGCAASNKMAWPELATTTVADNEDDVVVPAPSDTAQAPVAQELLPASRQALDWPLYARAITSYFGIRTDPINNDEARFHRGIDLSASYGAVVYAAAPGRVITSGWRGGHGKEVVLDHGQAIKTTYSHLSIVLVSAGMAVERGQPVGLVGESGRATGPHLHFEVLFANNPVDPLPLLGPLQNINKTLSATTSR